MVMGLGRCQEATRERNEEAGSHAAPCPPTLTPAQRPVSISWPVSKLMNQFGAVPVNGAEPKSLIVIVILIRVLILILISITFIISHYQCSASATSYATAQGCSAAA